MVVLGVGLLVPAESKAEISSEAQTAAWIAGGVLAAVCTYIASKQKTPKAYRGDSSLNKAVSWFSRVICGSASKKVQKVEINEFGEAVLKDTYTPASGLFGHAISFYDANEKEIKRAAAVGGMVALGSLNTNIKEIIVNLFKGAPYAELIKAPRLVDAASIGAAAKPA